jgi:hypothetical protein
VNPLVVEKPEAVVPAIMVAAGTIESPQGVTSVIERL